MGTKDSEEFSGNDRTEGTAVVAVDIRGEEKNADNALISFSKHDRVGDTEMSGEEIMEGEKTTKKIRTAAYCRVSTAMEIQEGSYEIQVKYYTDLIKGNADMEFVGIYGDRGRSGLTTDKRPGLQALLKDCRDGKIDLILSKSVSRFARNMGDFVEMVRELRKMGINLYFEKEKADTKDPQMDWILDTLAIIAEEESNSISEHVKASYAENVKEGKPHCNPPYGYVRRGTEDHQWAINGEEAQRVRRAFFLAGEGKNYTEILASLNAMEDGGYVWKQERLKYMLRNVAYKGDFHSHGYVNITPGKSVPNNGIRDRYYLKGHHEAIVPEDLFDLVQEKLDKGLLITNRKKTAVTGGTENGRN